MNSEQINNLQTNNQMSQVKKSSNMFIGSTILVILAIIVIGFVFG